MKSHVLGRLPILANIVNIGLLGATCESISHLQLPDTAIAKAETVAGGNFAPPAASPTPTEVAAFRKLPAFCRVTGVIRPSSESHIEFEVWMPSSGWNGRYLGVGNGGFGGTLNYVGGLGNVSGMAQALAAGYATASTDTGHRGTMTDADWALGHPDKVIDYGYRAIHLTAVNAKAIIDAYYGHDIRQSYFSGCSNGGRQALMEAQRYPADYAGIVAGDASWFATHLSAAQIWNVQAIMANRNGYIPASKVPAIAAAVLGKCDALDGVTDGVIEDPTRCDFNPEVLLCNGAESNACLTAPQVEALRKIYAGPADSRGRQIFPGILPGGEIGANGWANWITGSEPGNSYDYLFGVGGLAKLVYQNPSWDFRTFNFDRDVAVLDEKLGPVRNATDANLKSFKDGGGKLILYHGWSDADISPLSTISYYKSVVANVGQPSSREFVRLYMVPGMQHCGGGPGATVLGAVPDSGADPQHGIQAVLVRWVERNAPPEEIIATKYKRSGHPESGVAGTGRICPYPKVARYKGTGSTEEAASFSCVNER